MLSQKQLIDDLWNGRNLDKFRKSIEDRLEDITNIWIDNEYLTISINPKWGFEKRLTLHKEVIEGLKVPLSEFCIKNLRVVK